MDLSKISDLNQLKAMAYDEIRVREQASANLQAINTRVQQIETETAEKAKTETKND